MKKILSFILIFCFAFFAFSGFGFVAQSSNAAASSIEIKTQQEFETIVDDVLAKYALYTKRVAGTTGEKSEADAAEYILNYLNTNTTLIPKNTNGVVNGIQKFQFESKFEGGYHTSQNIVFVHEAPNGNGKKVIIGSHYDSLAYNTDMNSEEFGKVVESESISTSAGNVALMMALSTFLPELDLAFDVEFVFFGAGESNHAGSDFYTDGISEKDKQNILCMINLDDLALGKNTYFYVDEVETKMSKVLSEISEHAKLDVKKVNTIHLNKTIVDGDRLGLGYTHIALDSDNVCFMQEKILTINMFAGDYESGIVLGRSQFDGIESIGYTTNDTLAYIAENYAKGTIQNNLYKAYKMVAHTLTDIDFLSVCESGSETGWLYGIFANDNLVIYLTAVALVLFVGIGSFIHYKLSVKAYHANIELEFLSTVVKISEQVDKTGKDENVPKVVSQVIAADIKKDKIIKGKKPKDKK